MDRNRNSSVFVTVMPLLYVIGLLTIQLSDGFSIQIPASKLADLGFERSMGDMTESKRSYRQEVPLSALLQRSDSASRNNIFKRTNANAKPATCTCTCETKPVEPSAYKRVLSSRGHRPGGGAYQDFGGAGVYNSPYDYQGQVLPVKKYHKTHHETPATCTCTCETHPADDAQAKGSNPQPGSSQQQHKQPPQPDLDSIFWNDAEEYGGQGNNNGGYGEQPQSAALTSSNKGQQDASKEEKSEGGWGHTSRYPWKNLPDTVCYRDRCDKDSDCCMRYNLCDRSAKVCVDCWYGASCQDESNCCYLYPICKTEAYPAHNGVPGAVVVTGKCVDKL